MLAEYTGIAPIEPMVSQREVRNYEMITFNTFEVGERETRRFDGIKLNTFIISTEATKEVRELQGFIPWESGRLEPRRNPLEISWTKTKR